jgi:hypothetical protein
MPVQDSNNGTRIRPLNSGRVILPDSGGDLLRREVALALDELGFSILRVKPESLHDPANAHYLPRLLEERPSLLLSVNMQGILPGGAVSKMLVQAAAQNEPAVLVWFVDNPWHVLSGMRDPGWKYFTLAVTDHLFEEPLRRAGAGQTLHLPLAASPQLARQADSASAAFPGSALRGVVFAGRTDFPGKEAFFEGLEIPPDLAAKARQMDLEGRRTDFDWWLEELGLGQDALWPGRKARLPGLGAAQSNKLRRGRFLEAVAGQYPITGGLTLFGDSAWRSCLPSSPGLDLRPPFDYYAHAHSIYNKAEFSLNLNSLLLGAGLTQRIFDIWISRGFCLTDASPGLAIFPPELTKAVTFNTPEELTELIACFKARPKRKRELARAWHEHILQEHSYKSRLSKILF